MTPYKAEKSADRPHVRVSYDPDNPTTVRVYSLDWRFICEAGVNDYGVATGTAPNDEHVSQAIAEERRYKRNLKFNRQHREIEHLSTMERAARIAADDRKPTPPPESPMQVVQTPLDGQAELVERGRVRKAAGAESASAAACGDDDILKPAPASLQFSFDEAPLDFDFRSRPASEPLRFKFDQDAEGEASHDGKEAGHLLDQL